MKAACERHYDGGSESVALVRRCLKVRAELLAVSIIIIWWCMTVLNISQVIAGQASSRGLDGCPVPCADRRVQLAMLAWGRWQWDNRDHVHSHGFPSINPVSIDWGLGRSEDFEPENPMPNTVELVHQLLMEIDEPIAAVVAWCNWAKPNREGVIGVARVASQIMPYNVTRNHAEQWLGVVSGAVMCAMGRYDCEDAAMGSEPVFLGQ